MTPLVLPRDRDDDRVSRFDVERLAVGELTGADKARVEAAVKADPALQAFFDDVVAADKAFLFEHPPAAFFAAARPAPSLADKLRAFLTAPQLVASLCAAAAVAVIVQAPIGEGPRERSKGGAETPTVGFFVLEKDSAGDVARLGHAGDALRAGDKIQLAVKDVDKVVIVVVGVDGSGVVSVYAREAVSTTAKGPSTKARLLPASLVLDDTTGPERFFVVYGDDLGATEAEATEAAAALAKDILAGTKNLVDVDRLAIDDDDVAQASIHIVKVR